MHLLWHLVFESSPVEGYQQNVLREELGGWGSCALVVDFESAPFACWGQLGPTPSLTRSLLPADIHCSQRGS